MIISNPKSAQIEAVTRLEAAINLKDAAKVEAAMGDVLHAGVDVGCSELQAAMCSLLVRLLNAPWYSKHEVVVACIAACRCAEAVSALEEAAYTSLTSNDVYCTVARMCFLALADIGTPEARAALERLPVMP
jgi:hypothetical protein